MTTARREGRCNLIAVGGSFVHLRWHDDRTGKKFRQSELSGMGRSLAFRRDYEFSHDGPPTSSDDQRTAGTVFARVAQESGQAELESSLVSGAAYRIHHPPLLHALCHPVLCLLRRHELVPGWRDSWCERRMDCRSLFLPQFHPDQANCAAEPGCLGADRMRNAFPSLAGAATV